MLRSDFHFDLPEALIAQYPSEQRSASRLLTLNGDSGELLDGIFRDLPVRPGDLLVCNDTEVIPARLHGHKSTGGKVEILLERLLNEHCALAQVRAGRSFKPGGELLLEEEIKVTVLSRKGDLFKLRFDTDRPLLEILKQHGRTPLPPYITHTDTAQDSRRYQTVYARHPGAVAAPTAGLHFDRALLDKLAAAGVEQAFVTLHVGAGTFQPMRVERVEDHRIHPEIVRIGSKACAQIRAARQRGGRIIAVGTTTIRSLETACQSGKIRPFHGETSLFIYPGYRFRCVDALVTNFHLPESSLLMLVAAFAGYRQVMKAYRHAVAQRYRFFSYGDAMFITRRTR